MYDKNLTEDFRLRLSKKDMDFLKDLSNQRAVSVSECVRSIIGEYRRALDTMDVLKNSLELAALNGKGADVHGDTEADINNLV